MDDDRNAVAAAGEHFSCIFKTNFEGKSDHEKFFQWKAKDA